jgi:hypothetical protein
MKENLSIQRFTGLLLLPLLSAACTKVAVSDLSVSSEGAGVLGGTPSSTTTMQPRSPFFGNFDFISAINGANVWVASNNSGSMDVHLISIDQPNYPSKKWKLKNTPGLGNRTYVSEIGLLIGKHGGKVYRVSEDMPNDRNFEPIWTAPKPWPETRACLTSFQHDSKSYIGIAWEGDDNKRRFTKIPIDHTMPEKINPDLAQTVTLGDGKWSYGCFTDQGRKHFWGAWVSDTRVYGINLVTLQPLVGTEAPNAGHTSSTLGTRFKDPGSLSGPGSYALSGDANGNVITGQGVYTYAHEARSNVIFGTHQNTSTLRVAPATCFTTQKDCTGQIREYSMSPMGELKPMSSLNDGRVAAIVRGSISSQVYILKLNDPSNLDQGIDAVRVAEVPGNAYMYTDFTGATLFQREIDLTVNFQTMTHFNSGQPISSLSMQWTPQAAGVAKWQGIKLMGRCYQEGADLPAFQEITNIRPSDQITPIQLASCMNRTVNRMDLQARPTTGAADFTRTTQIRITGSH